jgi:phosphatidylserine/phosphatidylglycerophosphate/cardiolipin synthase-like enzyme
MSLPRDLVELNSELEDSNVDVFSPLTAGTGLLASPAASSMVSRLHSITEPSKVLQLCLQSLRVQRAEYASRNVDAEFVATLPPSVPGIARSTGQVLREMLRGSPSEVILLGYELTDGDTMLLLEGVAASGADVIVICDRGRGAGRRILENWPHDKRQPRVFEDRERIYGPPYSSMHAKCLLVDGVDLLITSANFTFHGLHGNIEFGVRLRGKLATEARQIFSHLVEAGLVTEIVYER